jgi:hypothetical protein
MVLVAKRGGVGSLADFDRQAGRLIMGVESVHQLRANQAKGGRRAARSPLRIEGCKSVLPWSLRRFDVNHQIGGVDGHKFFDVGIEEHDGDLPVFLVQNKLRVIFLITQFQKDAAVWTTSRMLMLVDSFALLSVCVPWGVLPTRG